MKSDWSVCHSCRRSPCSDLESGRTRAGQWWLLGVLAVVLIFNYLLGEELIFRGILLPKMNGVFGRWDFIAKGVLFATYHLHMIWGMPSQLFIDWIYA